jgi:hypothetical protein
MRFSTTLAGTATSLLAGSQIAKALTLDLSSTGTINFEQSHILCAVTNMLSNSLD